MSIPVKQVDIVTLLREYNKNLENQRLKALYNSVTVFDIIGKGRNETAHSSFLNWLLTANEVQGNNAENPLIGLLDCLVRRIYKQYRIDSSQQSDSVPYSDIEPISNALLSRTLKIVNIEGQTEVPVTNIVTTPEKNKEIENWYAIQKKKKNKGKRDSIDIRITCDVGGIDGITQFEFIIENKIGSKEGDKKNKSTTTVSDSYGSMMQTERYYYACNNGNQDGIYQFFIYLSPASEDELKNHANNKKRLCSSNKFICINYQDIYDDVISPLLESQQLPQREEHLIQEYVRVLSIPLVYKSGDSEDNDKSSDDINTSIILATSKAERDLLIKYWNNNSILIIAALQAYERTENAKEHNCHILCIDDDNCIYTMEDTIEKYHNLFVQQSENDTQRFNKIIRDFFKATKDSVKNTRYHDIVCKETKKIKSGNKKLKDCYNSICKGELFNDIACSLHQLSYSDKYNGVLCDFWEVNKFLIMASSRIMAENNMIYEDLAKAVKESYKGMNNRDFTKYDVSYKIKDREICFSGYSIAIYKWYAQTLIWHGGQGRLSIKDANNKFNYALGLDHKEMLSDNPQYVNNTSWVRLERPNWCQKGDGESPYYLNKGSYRKHFQKLLEYLEGNDGQSAGYNVKISNK